ncbi:hypothetical protein PanWU01x14_297710 [Parasponia andersonii]|uniref:Uncharacterized protein n=1 Tax=Parasponia andersonii TaxID=3476 RepID=A0A2P5AV28_PARAD|nr:hypothetical protein PanWU01x14_297710 [Parasponia andersonii]
MSCNVGARGCSLKRGLSRPRSVSLLPCATVHRHNYLDFLLALDLRDASRGLPEKRLRWALGYE